MRSSRVLIVLTRSLNIAEGLIDDVRYCELNCAAVLEVSRIDVGRLKADMPAVKAKSTVQKGLSSFPVPFVHFIPRS